MGDEMTDKETQSLFLWVIEEMLELNRRLDRADQFLQTLLTSVSLPPEKRQPLEAMLGSYQSADLIHVLAQAADSIREKKVTAIREDKE
jgi:hypothetical protein